MPTTARPDELHEAGQRGDDEAGGPTGEEAGHPPRRQADAPHRLACCALIRSGRCTPSSRAEESSHRRRQRSPWMTVAQDAPLFALEGNRVPRHVLPPDELPPDVAYQIVHDELMLDGNARLNVATFVTTWMEPQAEALMAECLDKNMIDKDEYPQTAELEMRCVNMLSRLWHGPDHGVGCSTTGSSEAAMLGGLALKRRWQKRRAAVGEPTDKPNLVMGINVQVCWEKFANYWDVEMR